MFNAQASGVKHPNAVVGMALFCGGLAQLLAGMWEFPKGNTFGATGELTLWLNYFPTLFFLCLSLCASSAPVPVCRMMWFCR
jgi:succinate-acetate transporter protein